MNVLDAACLHLARYQTSLAYRRDWRQLPVKDNGEPLVALQPDHCHPYYYREMGLGDNETVFVREGLVDRFDKACQLVEQAGYQLVCLDGWRSVEVQSQLFWLYLARFTVPEYDQLTEHFRSAGEDTRLIEAAFHGLPEITQATLMTANRRYVSWPSTDVTKPSPHATGGAIDVWLYQDSCPVDLGVPFDHMAESAGAFYHLRRRRDRFPGDRRVVAARSLLISCMLKAGFSVYPGEFWHFNYGNQMHALTTRQPARYSYTEPAA